MKTTRKASVTPKAAAKSAPIPSAKPVRRHASASKPARNPPAAPQMPLHAPEVSLGNTHVEIATRAYFIYVSAGCPQGRELQHWLEAEAQLTRR